jgi:hypothetical protein
MCGMFRYAVKVTGEITEERSWAGRSHAAHGVPVPGPLVDSRRGGSSHLQTVLTQQVSRTSKITS